MSQSEDLAQRFEEANAAFIAAVEACGDSEWALTTSEESWTAAALAHHVAEDHLLISGLVTNVGAGGFEMPMSMEQLNEMNAAHAAEYASVGKAEVLELAKANGAAAAEALRAMSDEQLAETAEVFGQPMSAAQLAENILIGHAQGHTASFNATTGQS